MLITKPYTTGDRTDLAAVSSLYKWHVLFISHFSKQPNLAGTSLYALIIRVSGDLQLNCFDIIILVLFCRFRPFSPQEYKNEVHQATYLCKASSESGVIHSRHVKVKAGDLLNIQPAS